MSDVGDLLELLYGAGDRWTTVQADPEHGFSSPLEQHASHLDPVQLVPALRFVSIDRGDVVVARAQQRPVRAEGVARAEAERDGTFVVLSSQTHDEGVLRDLAEDLVRV